MDSYAFREFLLFCLGLRLMNKQYADCASAAVGGDRTACTGNVHVSRGNDALYLLGTLLKKFFGKSCVGNENAVFFNIGSVPKSVGDVLAYVNVKFSAILLAHHHLAFVNGNAGLELEKICAKCGNSGASATLVEKFKIVDNKGRVHSACHPAASFCNFLGTFAFLCHLSRRNNEKSAAG